MSRKDIITGKWEASSFTRRGVAYVKSTIKIKGYDSITETRRANSIWGDIENIRATRSGHTKADLYDGKTQIATMTLHKKFDFFGNYGNQLSGRFNLNLKTESGKFWEPSLANHWVYKASYNDLF
jgi:hypothetical protein